MKYRLLKSYVETLLASGLNQLIEKLTRMTWHAVSLIDHILTNSKEKVRNYGVISNGISDHDFIYCTRKTKSVIKAGKHNNISMRSYRKYSKESLLERLRKKIFQTFPLSIVLTPHTLTWLLLHKVLLMKLHQWKIFG